MHASDISAFGSRTIRRSVGAAALLVAGIGGLQAQEPPPPGSCDWSDIPGVVWWGPEQQLPLERLAAYAAPVLWHSPDEPELEGRSGLEITAPEALPLESADGPVLYYQLKEVRTREGAAATAYRRNETDPGRSLVDLAQAALFKLEYYAYYTDEVGVGAHVHDLEPAEFRIAVVTSDGPYLRDLGLGDRCAERMYLLAVTRVTGKAHGLEWYWNIVEVDDETWFPMHLFVEEGKHGLATDRNADGYFTPAYDVTVRVNDAWGVRDIIRSGGLFVGGYENWMTKVRRPEHRVFPPLPADSPLLPDGLERESLYTAGNAVYELRPLPAAEEVAAWDSSQASEPGYRPLLPFIRNNEVPGWPEVYELTSYDQVDDWLTEGVAKKSLSIAAYADGSGLGVSWVFPLFVVKNLEIGMTGGYLLHRMYLKGDRLEDFGWMLHYANSGSRWVDSYLSAGVEWHVVEDDLGALEERTDFVLETGLKFRAQVGTSPLKFLAFFTDFWGFRVGIKNYGFFDIDRLTYVLELGAGSF